jgi:hypothetical protein
MPEHDPVNALTPAWVRSGHSSQDAARARPPVNHIPRTSVRTSMDQPRTAIAQARRPHHIQPLATAPAAIPPDGVKRTASLT